MDRGDCGLRSSGFDISIWILGEILTKKEGKNKMTARYRRTGNMIGIPDKIL
jgi:hypothetical protein